MNNIVTLTRRELAGYFQQLTGYVIIASVMLVIGLSFIAVILAINGEAVDSPITESLYSTPFFWLIILLAGPAITMRTYAHEQSTGTFETLVTAPVTSREIVIAKFLGSWAFFVVVWFPFIGYMFALKPFFDDPSLLDIRILCSSFLGVSLLGALYTAIGCLASSMTRSQMLAAMTSFALGMILFLQSFITFQLPEGSGYWSAIFAHTSMFLHLEDFVRGVVDSRHILFYLSLTGFFLYLNWQAVESRRWL
jgi:ABC-2 type transport system permease protein